MNKKYDFLTLYFAVVFTLLAVSLFENVSVVMVRAIAAGMALAFMPLVIIEDKIHEFASNLHESYHERNWERVRDTAVREVMRTEYPN